MYDKSHFSNILSRRLYTGLYSTLGYRTRGTVHDGVHDTPVHKYNNAGEKGSMCSTGGVVKYTGIDR